MKLRISVLLATIGLVAIACSSDSGTSSGNTTSGSNTSGSTTSGNMSTCNCKLSINGQEKILTKCGESACLSGNTYTCGENGDSMSAGCATTSSGSTSSGSTSSGSTSSGSSGTPMMCTKDLNGLAAGFNTACLGKACCNAAAACAIDMGCVTYDKCTFACFKAGGDSKTMSNCIAACKNAQGGAVPAAFASFNACTTSTSCRK
jgi:hypothetical protein